jgi:hypothetical protein
LARSDWAINPAALDHPERELPHDDYRRPYYDYRFMHDDYRRPYDDFLMIFMSHVPVPSAFRNKTSDSIEKSDNGGQGKDCFHVQFVSHHGVRLRAEWGLLYGV